MSLMRYTLGYAEKSANNEPKPLIETDKPSTSKEKPEDSHAFTVTKQRVTTHWLGKRARAFDSTENFPSISSTAHESLFRAFKEGKIRKAANEPSYQSTPETSANNGLSGLVAYDDSD